MILSLIFMPINLLQKFLDNNGRIDHYEIIVENFNELELIKSHFKTNHTRLFENCRLAGIKSFFV